MTNAILVTVTAASRKEADKMAQVLVEEKLAACVSIVPEMYSRYHWKGHMEYDKELLLIIKTERRLYKRLEKRLLSIHSYDVPEILAIPIVTGNLSYLKWLKSSLE